MSESTLILIAGGLGALFFLVALGVIWKRYGARIDTADLLPHNIQLVIDGIRAENKREIVAMKTSCDDAIEAMQRSHSIDMEKLEKRLSDSEQLVAYLTSQLVAAGGRPMPVKISQVVAPEKRAVVVLGLWPVNADLDSRGEIDRVFASGISYVPMEGNVSKRTVVSALEREKPTILHFGGHANADGTAFDDGVAQTGWWSNIAQRFPFKLVVLLACSSLEIVDAMADAGVGAVVGMRGEIKDTVAVAFAGEFYNRLMRGQTVGDAVSYSKRLWNYKNLGCFEGRNHLLSSFLYTSMLLILGGIYSTLDPSPHYE